MKDWTTNQTVTALASIPTRIDAEATAEAQ